MKNRRSAVLIILSFIAFISLGMPDGLLGVAWPGIRESFSLSLDAMGFLLIFSTTGYMISSFFSGALVRKLGIGGLLFLSCAATSASLFIYGYTSFWLLFVVAAFNAGLGAGAIDAGINTYVEKNHSERMMQWLHASFGVGVTLGPVIMTLAISLSGKWVLGYRIVAMAQAALAALFLFTSSLWKNVSLKDEQKNRSDGDATLLETIKSPGALLSMALFFLYVGVELVLGLWGYSLLTISRSVDAKVAGFITGSYWAMFTIGRIAAGVFTKKIPLRTTLYVSLFSALAGSLLVALNLGSLATVTGIAVIGFAIAPIFPCLISDTANRVGSRHVANTIGMQISAAGFGVAVVPSVAGVLARVFNLEIIPLFLFACISLLLLLYTASHRNKRH